MCWCSKAPTTPGSTAARNPAAWPSCSSTPKRHNRRAVPIKGEETYELCRTHGNRNDRHVRPASHAAPRRPPPAQPGVPRRRRPQDHGHRRHRRLLRQARHADLGGAGLRPHPVRGRRLDPADRRLEGPRGGDRAGALHARRDVLRAPLLAGRRRAVRQPDEPLPEEPGHHRRHALRLGMRAGQPGRREALTRLDEKLISDLERANIHPLWDRYKRITPVAPRPKDAPMHWRWRNVEPFTERAAREVGIEDVERRALILTNPAFGGETVTTQKLNGAVT